MIKMLTARKSTTAAPLVHPQQPDSDPFARLASEIISTLNDATAADAVDDEVMVASMQGAELIDNIALALRAARRRHGHLPIWAVVTIPRAVPGDEDYWAEAEKEQEI